MLIVPERNALLLRSRNPEQIINLIPRAKLIPEDQSQGHNVAVRYGLDEVKMLRNIGIKVPAPIRTMYKWPGPYTQPFDHQITTSEFLTLHRKAFVFNEMGLGKSASMLWAMDYLMLQGQVRRALVIAPMSTLGPTWNESAFSILTHRRTVVLHGSRQKRLDLLATDWEIAIINFDGLKIISEQVKADQTIDLVAIDEASNAYRNASTSRYKTLKATLRPDMRLWLATGTPCPNAPTDAWALARLVNPNNVPEFFGTFKRNTMMQVTQFKWAPRPEGYEMAYAAMQPAIRFKKADCLDLPPVTYIRRECALSPEQHAAAKTMIEKMAAEIGEAQLNAVNAADKLNKLRQIYCGVVKDTESGEYVSLDYKPRLEVMLECIEEAAAKVIIIVPFKGIISSLARDIAKHHTVEVLNGDVSKTARDDIIARFKHTDNPHVLLCHPKVMAHGLTLTEADMMIFYAPIYSNDEYQQVTERINRPGQTRNMTIVQMGAAKVEWGIYAAVEQKKEGQENILSLYKQALEDA